jgi:predicted CoA-binding protein
LLDHWNGAEMPLGSVKLIALVGASPKPDRTSNRIVEFLQARRYRVTPVNSGAKIVWMQLGLSHDEAAAKTEKAGLTVMDCCPKIDLEQLGDG